ncbi:hypothetical protein [Taylorella asinigenitalis]|uniref:hypothetical protein n=1 Tax=Taylorella asinigenitalis TaxID=84590 RepID=UPI0005D24993|nr:hypothetical protein [Taylorella asinigenitalis]
MKAIKFVVIIFVILAILLGIRAYKHHKKIRKTEVAVLALRKVNYEELYKTNPLKIYEDLDKHWNATVGAYLKDELWHDEEVYDAGHFLKLDGGLFLTLIK